MESEFSIVMTITEFHSKLKEKNVSVRETVLSYLDTIHQENKKLHAFLEVFGKDELLDDAKELDERMAHGEEPGALWGVPFAIKDNILIRGRNVSAGSRILENYVASYDATVTERLRRAGALFLGRTNMDEFAMGSSTENSAYGPTRNPHQPSYVPGGSSGGSAVAVAAQMAMAALGSDTGGSIRQPAAFCGVVGLKPTYGAVSRSGLIAMASSLDQIGPLAQSVGDAETVFKVIRGVDGRDSTSVDFEKYSQGQKNVKTIGVPAEYFGEGLDPRIREMILGVIKKLGKKYEVREIHLPHTKYALPCYYIIVPAEVSSNMARFDGIRYGVRVEAKDITGVYKKSRGENIGKEVLRRILLGTYVLSHGYYDAYYARAQKVRSLIKEDFKNAFHAASGGVDVIVCPTTPTLPFKIGEKVEDPLAMYLSDIYTIPVNLAGIPALSLPVGAVAHDGARFPVGLQLMAPHFSENRLFEVGKTIEVLV